MRLEEILYYRLPGATQRRGATVLALLAAILLLPAAPRAENHSGAGTNLSDEDRQRQTVIHLREISQAFMTWQLEAQQRGEGSAARKPEIQPVEGKVSLDSFPALSAQDLRRVLVPKYLAELPDRDGWGNPIEFRGEVHPFASLVMRSPGRDDQFESQVYPVEGFEYHRFDRDIVHIDGYFLTWPTARSAEE